ncbi:uncharacterized protein LOC127865092 isoform X3 [Dreissena polymorpha]|uniref:uncharacterized protein LOC127865092 isoform X3 n=1 Tax=Dreissena polymorpha TaxID=45954 RepID=UPI00226500C5|nr:uncharacterized protein LOC127865092 isoform X3 [Dreissena polymorpha]
MVGSTIGLSCLTLFSLFCLLSLPSRPDGWFYHRSVLSSSLIPVSALSLLPSGPDGWFYHRSVLSYTLLPVSAFSPSQACQMVGSTIGPSCLPLSFLFLPSLLPSGPDGWFYHRSVLSYTLLPVSAFSPSQACQMVGSTIGPSCLTLFSLFLPSFPSQAGQMVGSTIGLSCLTLFSLFCLLSLPSRPDGWFYHRSVLSFSLIPVSALSPLPSGPDGWFYHRSVLSYTLLPVSALSLLPSRPDGWFYHRSVLSYTLLPVSAFSPSQACQMVGSTIGPSCLPLSFLFLPSLLPSGPDGWFYHRSVLSYTLLPVSAFSPSQAGQMVDSTIGPSCLTLFCLFLPYLLQRGPDGWFYHFANPGDVSYTKCLKLLNMHLFSFF